MKRKINYLDKEFFVDAPISVLDIVGKDKGIYACYVNGRLRELSYVFDYDASIVPLGAKDRDAKFLYEASLRFIIAMAMNRAFPSVNYNLSYSISRCIYLSFTNHLMEIDDNVVAKLEKEMRKIVNADYPFNRYKLPKNEIFNIYHEHGFYHKEELFRYRPEDTAHIYECNGYYNYMYSRMMPSTGFVDEFKLFKYNDGILIQYPRPDSDGKIPEFKDAPVFAQVLAKAKKEAAIIGADSVVGINKKLERDGEIELISLAEAIHSRQLSELGDIITSRKNIRLICIAGPSSSGKTTFSNRLRIELLSRGVNPLTISLDDYYLPLDQIKLDEVGNYDFENIYSLDLDLFNQNMLDLIDGKSVNLPHRDFKTKQRSYHRGVHIDKEQPIIIEGIHALNELMTKNIPNENIYRIFIAPSAQIQLDNDNPLTLTDVRLLRRLVRDYKYRGESAESTMNGWDSVRRGEFKWIYHTQENADYIFNSFLAYELCALKAQAEPLLMAIQKDSPYFPMAERLLRLLKFFDSVSEKWIPCNSLLKEFLGGSCYDINE